jgi:quercetin dioxygenase-like cupin family protein
MINYFWRIEGNTFSIEYHMTQGSVLMTHSHAPSMLHDVHVIFGHVELELVDQVMQGIDGDTLTFDGSKPHSIKSITHSVIRNKFINGMPPEYKNLPKSEHTGTIP